MNIPERSKNFEMKDGFLSLTKDGLVVSNIHERGDAHHNRSGHYKVKPTTERIRERFTWKNLDKDVKEHIAKCVICRAATAKGTDSQIVPRSNL